MKVIHYDTIFNLKMKSLTFKFIMFVLIISFLSSTVSAKKILFYDVGAGGYSSSAEYSKFKNYLISNGYDVSSLSRGTLTKDALEKYDILIMQNLGGTLKIEEMSAILWFVMQRGGGLFIDGGSPAGMNQLSILFGITVDSAFLVDATDAIPAYNSNYNFIVDRFYDYPAMRSVIQGIDSVGFYQGHGLSVTGNANIIATGDVDTYSETLSFTSGSQPPIAAALLFGNGLVFVITDPDFLSDRYIDEFSNRQFGLNVVDWLGISVGTGQTGNTTQELQVIIGNLKLENEKYKQQTEQLTTEKKNLIAQNNQMSVELLDTTAELEKLKSEQIFGLTKTSWAIIIAGICIVIAALIISKRKKVSTKSDETLSELGYEIEEGKPSDLTDLGIDESELNKK